MLEKIRFLDRFKQEVSRFDISKRNDILKWKGNIDSDSKILDMGSLGMNELENTLNDFLKSSLEGNVIGVDFIEGKGVDTIQNLNKFPYKFKDNSIDLIIAGEVIEHLSEPYRFLQECYRILERGGRLIITTPNMTSIVYILGIYHNVIGHGHCHTWNISFFDALIDRTDFKIVYKKLINSLASWDYILELFTNIFPVFKTGLFYVLEKSD